MTALTFAHPNEIHIWLEQIDHLRPYGVHLQQALSDTEEAVARKRVRARDGDLFRLSRGFLRQVLSWYVAKTPRDIHFQQGEFGKPYIQCPIEFNLSHSNDCVLLAVSPQAVGIDIEWCGRAMEVMSLAERFFTPQEADYLSQLPANEQLLGFLQIWVLKEAYIKYTGQGLHCSLKSFAVLPSNPSNTIENCRIQFLPAPDQYTAALACPIGANSIHFKHFDQYFS